MDMMEENVILFDDCRNSFLILVIHNLLPSLPNNSQTTSATRASIPPTSDELRMKLSSFSSDPLLYIRWPLSDIRIINPDSLYTSCWTLCNDVVRCGTHAPGFIMQSLPLVDAAIFVRRVCASHRLTSAILTVCFGAEEESTHVLAHGCCVPSLFIESPGPRYEKLMLIIFWSKV
jgi:hypothetical protein